MMDLAIVIPELTKYGGAERFLIECVVRWQDRLRMTLYASRFNERLLREHGVGRQVRRARISPYFDDEHSIVLNCALLPKIWEQEIGRHEMYLTHLWPTHLIDLHPAVWVPHEPLRILGDLRYHESLDGTADGALTHIYPKQQYTRLRRSLREAYLNSAAMFDKLGTPDRIVANSRYTARYLEEVYGRKVQDVVYPGADLADFLTMPEDKNRDSHLFPAEKTVTVPSFDLTDRNVLLSVGQLWPHKRVRLIVEAVSQVEGVQLYIVGSGPEEDRLRRMVEALGLSDRVFFLQELTNLELRILFARCLAVVFVPIREPFGIVALEAMAAGKPLIGVDEGGFTEVVDESCAMLVPPLPAQIAEKIRQLREETGLAERMGRCGRKRAAEFSWDRTAEELLAIIEHTLADWRAKHPPARVHSADARTLFGAQYYCWYGDGFGSRHWGDDPRAGGVTDMPAMGYYASCHGETIRRHVEAMERAGLDFAILNLHVDLDGPSRMELDCIENFFQIAQRAGSRLRLAVQVCPYDCRKEDLVAALEKVRSFSRRKHYLRLRGKPVLLVFWTGAFDYERSWIELLRERARQFVRIASSLRVYPQRTEGQKTFALFDGWTLFSPLEVAAREDWEDVWREAYHNSAAGALDLKIATVSPGYDDAHLLDPARKANPCRTIDREGGAIYRRMMDAVLSEESPPDLVIVSTFNEYHENSHIEASRSHGNAYMEMTRKFIETSRSAWPKQ